ncbi:leucine-rich repeat-containing protein 3-like [Platysternon megacephalum]|uniref:Leucine-rich repeat-containing protein 3-like n=1 Tax=Platysternon megacephalum TaxID=55544 RepID=A0A4D9E2V4_9SAUR|nr:leucine-rich repeat-containing protein 3-like [Platysternon megacephalum]
MFNVCLSLKRGKKTLNIYYVPVWLFLSSLCKHPNHVHDGVMQLDHIGQTLSNKGLILLLLTAVRSRLMNYTADATIFVIGIPKFLGLVTRGHRCPNRKAGDGFSA